MQWLFTNGLHMIVQIVEKGRRWSKETLKEQGKRDEQRIKKDMCFAQWESESVWPQYVEIKVAQILPKSSNISFT